jgi:hypothetical protein
MPLPTLAPPCLAGAPFLFSRLAALVTGSAPTRRDTRPVTAAPATTTMARATGCPKNALTRLPPQHPRDWPSGHHVPARQRGFCPSRRLRPASEFPDAGDDPVNNEDATGQFTSPGSGCLLPLETIPIPPEFTDQFPERASDESETLPRVFDDDDIDSEGFIGIDTNALIDGLKTTYDNYLKLVGFLTTPAPTKPLGVWVPDIAPQVIVEFVARDTAASIATLVTFMATTAAVIGAQPTEQQIQEVEKDSAARGAKLQRGDSAVVATYLIDDVPILTGDKQMLKYLSRINWPYYNWNLNPPQPGLN